MTQEEFEKMLAPNGGGIYLYEWVRWFKKDCEKKLGHKPSYNELKSMYYAKFNK